VRASGRSVRVIVLAVVLAGCGAELAPSTTPIGSGAPSPWTTSSPGAPSASRSVAPDFSTPDHPADSAPKPTVNGFVTPIPPDPAASWTGIRWTRLSATDELSHVRSVTRWRGGFIATGDLLVTGDTVRSKVWASADGRTWEPVADEAFGSNAVVVGVGGIADRVVALTVQSLQHIGNSPPTDPTDWTLKGPWQTWISVDGRTWTATPGPGFTAPRFMESASWVPTILVGAGNDLLAITFRGQPLAFSRDGVTWETASLADFPGGPSGWAPEAIAAFPPGFVAVGYSDSRSVALASADGHTWISSALPPRCPPVGPELTVGPAGIILVSQEGDGHWPTEVWCSSLDGSAWRRLSAYQPLGELDGDQELCRGTCARGFLMGNGERMIAYRGAPQQAAWTSFDGRTWQRLALSGSRPTRMFEAGSYPYKPLLAPFGILFVGYDDGSAWLGTPET
jgi:hypothetical protein